MNSATRDLSRIFPVLDAGAVVAAGTIAYWLRWQQWAPQGDYALALVLGGFLSLALLPATGAYQSWRGRDHSLQAGNALPGLALTFILLMTLATFSKTTAEYSRLWMGYWVVLAVLLLVLTRALLRRGLGWQRRPPPRVLIVGTDRLAGETAQRLQDVFGAPAVVGMLHLGDEPAPGRLPAAVLGELAELDALLAAGGPEIDEVWLASSHLSEESRGRLLVQLQTSCLTVRYVPDLSLLNLLDHLPSEVAGMTVIEVNASPLSGPNALLKAGLDRLGALILLLVLSPLLLLIAAAIRLDTPGPVLFRQQRHGGLGDIIDVYKFRTMRHDPGAGYRQATPEDDRVTRVGAVLRRSSLDELPQLLNVLRGNMSLVGPRPHPVALNHAFMDKIDAYMQRHRVKPGITGWAQVHGYRGETDTLDKMTRRVDYDLYYIRNWSLWLDIRILLLTVRAMVTGRNAY
ncbi:MAG TPA: undecaprenyl-phosphate glucose phosphotransferase [Pseudohaliea sp.]|nr:undecaprenyl-phosphate glucose phosphotransferase [Pseudohaliea sp.]